MSALRRRLRACLGIALLPVLALSIVPTVSRIVLATAAVRVAPPPLHHLGHATSETGPGEAGAAPDDSEREPHHRDAAPVEAASEPPPSPSCPTSLDACELCIVAALGCLAAPPPVRWAVLELRRFVTPRLRPASAETRSDWSPAAPRGPPARV